VDAAFAAGPGLVIDRPAFAAHVASLDGCKLEHAGELLLAFAAAAGSPRAVARVLELHGEMIAHAIRGVRRDDAFVDEARAELQARLFAGSPGTPPRLLRYAGKGPLGGWLRVAAVRLAIDLARSEKPEETLEDVLLAGDAGGAGIAARDRDVIREALRAAIAAQPSKSRTLLRFYYGEGLGVEELASLHGVHASTVSRWLATMREDIVAETRRQLAARLATSSVSSHLDLVHDLELSIASLLATPRP